MVEERTCRHCGKTFMSEFRRGTFAAYCPACKDLLDHRPSVVQERSLVGGPWVCVIESLPGEWEKFQARPDDAPCWRIIKKGKDYGASWSGRVDIYAARPFQVGDVVEIAEIEVVHRLKVEEIRRPTSAFVQLNGGPAFVTYRVKHPLFAPVGEETLETRRYLRLDAPAEVPEDTASLPRLVWVEAPWKTTLKGFGRQYRYRLAGAPIAQWAVSGSVRSGRKGVTAALAIVDEGHPLSVQEVFDR